MNQFISKWRRLHHPSMDVSGDVAFYYQVYDKLRCLTGNKARRIDELALLSLLLYTENIIAIGLDGVYEYKYRSVGNVVFRWCDALGMDAGTASEVHNLVSDAVAEAPSSALRQWIMESVLSHDFQRLSNMLTWFAREDQILRLIYPDLCYREAMFLRLTGDRQTARQMLWTDMAFHWRDKYDATLSATLARQLCLSASFPEEQGRALLRETAEVLGSIRSERLDTYTVIEQKDECTLTLRHKDSRIFENVILNEELRVKTNSLVFNNKSFLSEANEEFDYLAVQLVTYLGKTYINGPAVWLDNKDVENWNGERIWTDIINKEQEAARQRHFITAFGKRIFLYDDLYTIPADPDEARDAEWGIYPDEPDILDFMEWLKPGEAVDKVFCFR